MSDRGERVALGGDPQRDHRCCVLGDRAVHHPRAVANRAVSRQPARGRHRRDLHDVCRPPLDPCVASDGRARHSHIASRYRFRHGNPGRDAGVDGRDRRCDGDGLDGSRRRRLPGDAPLLRTVAPLTCDVRRRERGPVSAASGEPPAHVGAGRRSRPAIHTRRRCRTAGGRIRPAADGGAAAARHCAAGGLCPAEAVLHSGHRWGGIVLRLRGFPDGCDLRREDQTSAR